MPILLGIDHTPASRVSYGNNMLLAYSIAPQGCLTVPERPTWVIMTDDVFHHPGVQD